MTNNITIVYGIERACEFCEREFKHAELIEYLHNGSNEQKQICILKLEKLDNLNEGELLVFHLTKRHGIVREATAQKLNEFIASGKYNYNEFFQGRYVVRSFLEAINDVNPNICRLVVEILPVIEDKVFFLEILYERLESIFLELEKLKRSNTHTKKLFNLYWCLEALSVLNAPVDKRFESVIQRSVEFKEYTIREKTALVLSKLKTTTPVIEEVKALLRQDENFYVKRFSEGF